MDMKSTIFVVLMSLLLAIGAVQSRQVVPVDVREQPNKIELKMRAMGFPHSLAESVMLGSQRAKVSPEFIVALMQTESNFKEMAVSSKGYKGLMQIPHAVYDPDANILIGAKIFAEKMAIANNNLIKAICLYKGYQYGSEKGMRAAKEVIRIYHHLQRLEV